jgi:sulfide:quinone oxidoreductase
MSRVVVLGAGISGHTAALLLRRRLPAEHEVVVVSPKHLWNWIPSNIWVGVGILSPEDVTFDLRPIYARSAIGFHQARAVELHPEGSAELASPHVVVESTEPERAGERERVAYDYLVNATGPRLNFGATPGLGPEANSLSVCTADHAAHAAAALAASIEKMRAGQRQTFVIGMGHGLCTCEGAAFEYVFNLDFELRKAGVRDLARVVFLTNEADLGDFGVGGLHLMRGGYRVHSKTFAESLYAERGIEWITGAHVQKVEPGLVHYENLEGEDHALAFDFAMLLPPFAGAGMKAFARDGGDVTSEIFAPSGFMKVDAEYAQKPFAEWRASDWPRTYQSRRHGNLFAIGIAFAPPHPMSLPRKSKRGTPITPSPPRTGMPSAVMARAVAQSIGDMILEGAAEPTHTASLASIGASCVASAGASWLRGTATSMTMFPVVPDYQRFGEVGRDMRFTFGEIGSAGHWIKRILHYMFLYKARARAGWWLIPE